VRSFSELSVMHFFFLFESLNDEVAGRIEMMILLYLAHFVLVIRLLKRMGLE